MVRKATSGGIRERILDAATDLFYRKGINRVGVDEIVACSGVSKMSLYKHFGSKDMLVLAYVERWEEAWLARLEKAVEFLASEPRGRLLAVFDALGREFEASDFRGCARLNAAVELADEGHPAHRVCATKKERVRLYLRDLAEEAGLRDPEGLSRQLSLLLNGAIVTALVQESDRRSVAETARQAASALLDAH